LKSEGNGVRILSSIEFLQGDVKVYETKSIVAHELTATDRQAVIFQVEISLQSFKPGYYNCQINVIDDVAGNYAFPRWSVLIKAATPIGADSTKTPET
jgi:hypothetical protein